MNEQMYLILTSANIAIAKGVLETPPGGEVLQLKILDEKAGAVAEHEVLQLIGMEKGVPSLQCHFLRQRGDRVVLERLMTLDPELRRSLRIPARFDSFIYPLTGEWKGRRRLNAIDLSCGGIAFYSEPGLEAGEIAEVVIPVTTNPLIVRMQILRQRELKNGRFYYAAKFVDLQQDEDHMICEGVFNLQLQNRPHVTEAEEMEG